MKATYIRSLGLPKGILCNQFETLKEVVAHVKNDESKIVEVANKYGRQKDSLVAGREYLSDELDKLGFKRLTKTGTMPTDDTEFSDYEPEQKHIDRFVEATTLGAPSGKDKDGKITRTAKLAFPGLNLPASTANAEADTKAANAAALAFLQTVVDKHGAFDMDLNATVRVSRTKKIPDWAKTAAGKIIANGSQAGWVEKFTKGYTDKQGIAHPPVTFAPFTTAPDAKATPEQKAAVAETNVTNLAWAIVLDEEQRKQLTAVSNYA